MPFVNKFDIQKKVLSNTINTYRITFVYPKGFSDNVMAPPHKGDLLKTEGIGNQLWMTYALLSVERITVRAVV